MALRLRVRINGTDYGVGGTGELGDVQIEPGDGSEIGTATIVLNDVAGGISILAKQTVEMDVWNTSTSQIVRRLFMGRVARRPTETTIGTNLRLITVECQDVNLLGYQLVGELPYANRITVSTATLKNQVASMVSQLINGGSYTIDASTFVGNILSGTSLRFQEFRGKSLFTMLRKLCDEAERLDSTLNLRFRIGFSTTLPAASFGNACIFLWDAAPFGISHPPSIRFSDLPADYITAGTHKPIYSKFVRDYEASSQVTRRQATYMAGQYGGFITGSDSTAIAAYPNQYQSHGGWMAESLEYKDLPIDVATATASDVEAAAQTLLNQHIRSKAYPRESLTFDTTEYVLPGDHVSVKFALEGLSDVTYRVAASSVTYIGGDVNKPLVSVTLGQRILEIGDSDEDTILAAPIERDTVAPNAPTWPSGTNWIITNQYQGDGQTYFKVTCNANEEGDLIGYHFAFLLLNSADSTHITRVTSGPNPITTNAFGALLPATVEDGGYTVYAQVAAVDSSGNTSPPSDVKEAALARITLEPELRNGDFELVDLADSTKPADWASLLSGGIWNTLDAFGRSITWETTPANVYYGSHSIKINSPINGRIGIQQSGMKATPNVPVALRFRAKAQHALGRVYVFLTAVNNTGGTTSSNTFYLPGTSWALIETQSFTLPADTVTMNVEIGGFLDDAPGTSIWFDSIQISEVISTIDLKDGAVTTAKLNTTGISAGTYTKLVVGVDGRANSGSNIVAGDLPNHASRHESGGADVITHNNLSGLTTGDPHTQYLLESDNLASVANPATALTNIGAAPLASPAFTGNGSIAGSFAIGGGSAIQKTLAGSTGFNPPSLAPGAQASTSFGVTGAVLGDYVLPSFNLSLQGIQLSGYVSAADTVVLLFYNGTGGTLDLASGIVRALVFRT